jgi:hypothetical protein
VFSGIDLQRSTLRDTNFAGGSMHGVRLVDVSIDGVVDRLSSTASTSPATSTPTIPWQPLRRMLRPSDRDGLLASLDETDRWWAATIEHARALPDDERHESVNGEWSFVQTLRHLVLGIDNVVHPPLNRRDVPSDRPPQRWLRRIPVPRCRPRRRPDVRRGRRGPCGPDATGPLPHRDG